MACYFRYRGGVTKGCRHQGLKHQVFDASYFVVAGEGDSIRPWPSPGAHMRKLLEYFCRGCGVHSTICIVRNQGAKFDLASALSDRSRRTLPCDRSRRPAANQTNYSETALGGIFLSSPGSLLLPEVLAPSALVLIVVWARRRRVAWLVRHPISAPFPREGRPTRRRKRHVRLVGVGLAVTLLFTGAARAQQPPLGAVAIGGMYPPGVQVDQQTGRAFVLDSVATTGDGQPLDRGAIAVVGANGARLGVIPLPT